MPLHLGEDSAARREGGSIVMFILMPLLIIAMLVLIALNYDVPRVRWQNMIKEFDAPARTTRLAEGVTTLKTGGVYNTESAETETWMYYAVLHSEGPGTRELLRQYQPLVSQIDDEFEGYGCIIQVLVPDTAELMLASTLIPGLDADIAAARETHGDGGRLYVVLIYKPGRSYWYN